MPRRGMATAAVLLASVCTGFAGGGGENMLLVVNPSDPASLEIANAYAGLRDIPARNVLFITPPADYQNNGQPISQSEVTGTYITPIANAISSRGLTNQINYIGTIGEATCYSITPEPDASDCNADSLTYGLDFLISLTNGSGVTLQNISYSYDTDTPISGLYQDPSNIPVGTNPAILHSASYTVAYNGTNIATQYYMAGTIGYTGTNGNTASQVIASLQKAAASDGTRPAGAIYFEDNGDIRSTSRDQEWPTTEAQLTARGIAWVYEDNTPGATPQNRSNVSGAVCGATVTTLPNGSTYLPGSWADNLTSFGCDFADTGQTKATVFITSGAAATAGSVVEPYVPNEYPPPPPRFTNSSIYTFIADGSTLGEAFAKSVPAPDTQMLLGDILAQPYADVPRVTILSGPGSYGYGSGTISISATAALVNPRIATGIKTLELVVDGTINGTLPASSGTFNSDTTSLSDGVHEVRIVAINNSEAASEGYAAQQIVVNNHGRLINFAGGNATLTSSTQTIDLSVAAGDGTVSGVELTCLGRVVAQAAGAAGSLSLSPGVLAPGDNVIVPVALFGDGTQVAGGAFVAHVESGAVNSWSNGGGSGFWSNPSNWTSDLLPQNGDWVARFNGTGSGGTVTLDIPAKVAEIALTESGESGYTIAALPGETITLSTPDGAQAECLINVLSGSHAITAPLALASPGNLVNVTNAGDSLTISGGVSGNCSLTVTGSGTLVLAGSNSYTGVTTVDGGTLALPGGSENSPITVNSGASLGFTLGEEASSISTVTLNAGALVTITGTPTLESYTLMTASSISGTPALGTPIAGYHLVLSSGALILQTYFATWASSVGLTAGNNGPLNDPTGNGISNLLEYVLNGNPMSPSLAILPTMDASGSNYVFTFHRLHTSTNGTTQIFETSTDLKNWTDVTIPATTSGSVTVLPNTPSAGTDQITVTVGKGANTRLFGRLKVTQP